MQDHLNFYIDGAWVPPVKPGNTRDVVNPATEKPIARISMGSAEDVDRAVKAARRAFESYSRTTREERIALMQKIMGAYQAKYEEMAKTISSEMGAPIWLSKAAQAAMFMAHFGQAIEVLKSFDFEEKRGKTQIMREPVGVCGLITPWNWPINQIACKIAPALAAGCTIVLKPTEVAPLNAILLAQILHEAGVPKGVFNLVNGDGPTVGAAISSHPGVDMVSFTGSTRAGIQVAQNAAPTVKRVTQELGGKSANIVLEDADLQKAVDAKETELAKYPFLYVTGFKDPRLNDDEMGALRRHLQAGGFLFVNNCSGYNAFDKHVRKMVAKLFPDQELKAVPKDDALFKSFHKITGGKDRQSGEPRAIELEGVRIKKRLVLVYSKNDVVTHLKMVSDPFGNGYDADTCRKVAVNVVAYAMQN